MIRLAKTIHLLPTAEAIKTTNVKCEEAKRHTGLMAMVDIVITKTVIIITTHTNLHPEKILINFELLNV